MAGPYSQIGRQLGGSISSFFDPRARQAGELAGLQQAGMEQQLQLGALKMDAARQEAEQKAQEAAMRTPEAMRSRAMQAFGVPLANAADVQRFQTTGQTGFAPLDAPLPADVQGPTAEKAPAWAAPQNLSKVAQMFLAEQAVQGGAAKDIRGYFDAVAQQYESDLARQVVEGSMGADPTARALAVLKASPIYNRDSTGTVLNNYTGALNESGQLAVAERGRRQADADRSRAAAADSMAGVGLKRAQTEKTRQDLAMGGKGQYDSARGIIVDTRTGTSRPVLGADGQALPAQLSNEQKKELLSINQQRAIIAGAIDAAAANPTAFSFGRGLAGRMPGGESIAGRAETPQQTQARAYVFNNVSRVINERAGAAQSAQELARLNAFLPADTDTHEQVVNKLQGFQQYLADLEAGTRGQAAPAAPARTGGATGSWDAAPGGWKIERVR